MAILNNNPLVGASGNQGGYNINNSLRFRSSASATLTRTPASAGNRRTYTWSGWVKRGSLTSFQNLFSAQYISGGSADAIRFSTTDTLALFLNDGTSAQIVTTQVFRDPSAWYHIVAAVDTTQATASNRLKLYVNGSQITAFGTATYPTQNFDCGINNNVPHSLGNYTISPIQYFDGYMAEVNFIDGQALTPSSFGETDTTTGVWKPKAYSGTYGTNGFYLKFSDIATTSGSNAGLGKDFSGNGNYLTTNNISVTSGTTYDAMTDSPTNTSATVANYAVLNPLSKGTNVSITNANLAASYGSAAWTSAFGTIGVSTGKWYWEMTLTSAGTDAGVGISTNPAGSANSYIGGDANSWGYYASNGNKWNNNSQTSYGATYANGDVIGIALDLDAGTLVFYKNNVSQGTAFSSLASNTYFPALSVNNSSFAANFGQRPFSYTPPTGFVALNTFNLPTSTILQGNKYMDATLYTGNGSSQTITNAAGFRPDLFWAKRRNSAAWHALFDSVRGANSALYSNATNAQDTGWTGQSFTSTGFTVDATYSGETNANTGTFVGWQWQAGQGSTSSNTSGSITSTVSVSTTAGFSVVTYTGLVGDNTNRTIGHGLGVAPSFIIVKNRNWAATDYAWMTWHTSGNKVMPLNQTAASTANDYTYYFGGTAPTSTVFTTRADTTVSTGNRYATQGRADSYVAYCWADVSGYSKAFSYTGNGSSDGPMVYLGLKPKFVMLKRTDTTGNWIIYDSSRNTYNVVDLRLLPNTSDAEATVTTLDFLSNGFKLRTSDVDRNANGGTYIGIAFAENPFKNSNAR